MSLSNLSEMSLKVAQLTRELRKPEYLKAVFVDLFEQFPNLDSLMVGYGSRFSDGDLSSARIYTQFRMIEGSTQTYETFKEEFVKATEVLRRDTDLMSLVLPLDKAAYGTRDFFEIQDWYGEDAPY